MLHGLFSFAMVSMYSAKRSKQLVQPVTWLSRRSIVSNTAWCSVSFVFAPCSAKVTVVSSSWPGRAVGILPGEGEDDALRLDDFAIDAALPVIGALRRAHAEAVGAADADVHLAVDRGEALRSPPARDVLRLRPRLEHQRGAAHR